jgi:hypothetical protein
MRKSKLPEIVKVFLESENHLKIEDAKKIKSGSIQEINHIVKELYPKIFKKVYLPNGKCATIMCYGRNKSERCIVHVYHNKSHNRNKTKKTAISAEPKVKQLALAQS